MSLLLNALKAKEVLYRKMDNNIIDKISEYLNEKEQKQELDLKSKVIAFIVANPNPPDSKFHNFAEKLGGEPDELEAVAYSLLSDFFANGRFNEKGQDKTFDEKELAIGIDIEKEHTISKMMAERIAKDHLTEIPDYYTRLKKMEAEAGIKD